MKITHRKIQAAPDYRTFDGLSIDELMETNEDLFYDYFSDIEEDVDMVYISRNPDCPYVGVLDTEGKYYVYMGSEPPQDEGKGAWIGPGWYEVSFDQLFEYLQ